LLPLELAAVDTDWDIEDDFFDIALDSFSSIDIETREGREKCRDEMYRTLKPGSYALVTVCSADDEWGKELIASHPGLNQTAHSGRRTVSSKKTTLKQNCANSTKSLKSWS
jgi:hypothetical protein